MRGIEKPELLPLNTLRGVSDKRQKLLAKLGLKTWLDLLQHYPRSYEDWSKIKPIFELEDGETACFRAYLDQKPKLQHKGKLSYLMAGLRDESGAISATWFNQPWLLEQIKRDKNYIFRGKITRQGRFFSVQNPEFIEEAQSAPKKIDAVYPLTEGINQKLLRNLVGQILPEIANDYPDVLPAGLKEKYQLLAYGEALKKIHQPESLTEAEAARRRLAFDELFLTQAGMRLLKNKRTYDFKAYHFSEEQKIYDQIKTYLRALPFELTTDQKAALKDIFLDFKKEKPMNRLLQGDVGSGKTIVAFMAMIYVALQDKQSVFLVPTTVLASQHYLSFLKLFPELNLECALLTAATPLAERKSIKQKLATGELKLLIGTHAVFNESNSFKSLGLTIMDEQHRFGVEQRNSFIHQAMHAKDFFEDALKENGQDVFLPHTLLMSATPIPRTLAMVIYGDLDITLIKTMPTGRLPIETYLAMSHDIPRIETLMQREIHQGRQCYVVCPLIEQSETLVLNSAEEVYQRMKKTLPGVKVVLLHGKLKNTEKDDIIKAFLDGEIAVLVSTTVIEVGIDQPNANIMLIYNAERFGLAQLHQLRGRIGRGQYKSYCILLNDNKDKLIQERLKTVCRTKDGFELAERDLELRGPGEHFGTKQHGIPEFSLFNFYDDQAIMDDVQQALDDVFTTDTQCTLPQALVKAIEKRYDKINFT